jgi:hypothetical protein
MDMSFDEALKRFVQADARELPKPKAAKRRKKAAKHSSRVIPEEMGQDQTDQQDH